MVLSQSTEYVLREKLVETQIDDALKGIELKTAQIALTYVERVIKDKEAAKLGMDLVMKTASQSPAAVYTTKYNQ
jgi:hypothetical protein